MSNEGGQGPFEGLARIGLFAGFGLAGIKALEGISKTKAYANLTNEVQTGFTLGTEIGPEGIEALKRMVRATPTSADVIQDVTNLSEQIKALLPMGGPREQFMGELADKALLANKVIDSRRQNIVNEIKTVGSSEELAAKLAKYDVEFGGVQGIRRAARSLTNARSGEDLGSALQRTVERSVSRHGLIPGLSPEAAIAQPANAGWAERKKRGGKWRKKRGGGFWSEGDKASKSWREVFYPGGEIREGPVFTNAGPNQLTGRFHELNRDLERAGGRYSVDLTVRGGSRQYRDGVSIIRDLGGTQSTSIAGMRFDFAEALLASNVRGGGVGYLNLPTATAGAGNMQGINFILQNNKGMGFSAVSRVAVPKVGGQGLDVVDFTTAMQMMLYGDKERNIEGLAISLHKLEGNRKGASDLARNWNAWIRSVSYDVSLSKPNLAFARIHSNSVALMPTGEQLAKGSFRYQYEEIMDFANQLKDAGYNVGIPTSAGVAAGGRLMVGATPGEVPIGAEAYSAFGRYYPPERRYLKTFRQDLSLTERSASKLNLAKNKIFGFLDRRRHIAATNAGLQAMEGMPMAVGIYTLKGHRARIEAQGIGALRAEEGFISSRILPLIQPDAIKTHYLRQGYVGEVERSLRSGEMIGIDYETGREIRAHTQGGKLKQKIVRVERKGDMVRAEVQTVIRGLDDPVKLTSPALHGTFTVVKGGREGLSKHIEAQFGVVDALSKKVEVVAAANQMKGGKAAILEQMAQAIYVVGGARYEEAAKALKRTAGQQPVKSAALSDGRRLLPELSKFVRHRKIQENFITGATRAASAAEAAGEDGARRAGVYMLQRAKRMGISGEELAKVGGLFFEHELSAGEVTKEAFIKQLTTGRDALSKSDIKALEQATHVYGLPEISITGSAAFNRWRQASVDPRGLYQILGQKWDHGAGVAAVEEILTRTVPLQDYAEMERAVQSLTDQRVDAPSGTKTVTSRAEARKILGKQPFFFSFKETTIAGDLERSIYVPGGSATRMEDHVIDTGSGYRIQQGLKRAYSNFLDAVEGGTSLDKAMSSLRGTVSDEYARAGRAGGEVIGAEGLLVKSWWTEKGGAVARQFTEGEFMQSKEIFTVGVSEKTGRKMIKTLLKTTQDETERAFLRRQLESFDRGEAITALVMRHPMMHPESIAPTRIRKVVGGSDDVIYFPKYTVKMDREILDVSNALGMKADMDGDNAMLMIIGNEKRAAAIDRLMNGSKYRGEFLTKVHATARLRSYAENMASQGRAGGAAFVESLSRLVGVKMKTGEVSNLVNEMQMSAAYGIGDKDEFTAMSRLLANFEESAISSKKGMFKTSIIDNLSVFIKGGPGSRQALQEAWNEVYGDIPEITTKERVYKRQWFLDTMTNAHEKAAESGELAAYKAGVRKSARAAKGAQTIELSEKQLLREFQVRNSGLGNPLEAAIRSIRIGGVGSQGVRNRAALSAFEGFAGQIPAMVKPHIGTIALAGVGIAVGLNVVQGMDSNLADIQEMRISPRIPSPRSYPNRIMTGGGSSSPAGYNVSGSGEFGTAGLRNLTSFITGLGGGTRARIRDDRGSITPEYIRKAQNERYW